MDVSDVSLSDTDDDTTPPISSYEAAAKRRKTENLQLIKKLGIYHLSAQVGYMHACSTLYVYVYVQDKDKQSQTKLGISSTGSSSTKSSTAPKQLARSASQDVN